MVDVGREDEPEPVERRVGVVGAEPDAERPVEALPDPRPGGAGRRAQRQLEHAAAGAARRVAAADRVGEAVRPRRGELELDHVCSMTR